MYEKSQRNYCHKNIFMIKNKIINREEPKLLQLVHYIKNRV